MSRYFLRKFTAPLTIKGVTFTFDKAYRPMGQSDWAGVIKVDDEPSADLLAKHGPKNAVTELNEEEYQNVLKKKAQGVPNKHTTNQSQVEDVGRVEGKSPTETSSVDDIEDLLSGPKEEPVTKPEPKESHEVQDEVQEQSEVRQEIQLQEVAKPAKKTTKRRGRPRKKKAE